MNRLISIPPMHMYGRIFFILKMKLSIRLFAQFFPVKKWPNSVTGSSAKGLLMSTPLFLPFFKEDVASMTSVTA